MWTLAWNTHAFIHQPLSIFDANIYYPERHTLAYSESLIGSAFLAAPIIWLSGGNLVLALNTVTLLSTFLCGVGAYVLARKLEISESGALIAGLVFAFSPPRFLRIDQLHLTTIQWVPFGLAYLHDYLNNRHPRNLRLFSGFISLQGLTSGHGLVFLVTASLIVVAYRFALGEPLAITSRLRDLGVVGVLLLAPILLLAIPYHSVQDEMGLRRSLDHWAVSPASFMASPSHVHAWLLHQFHADHINQAADAYLFPGFLALLLALVAIAPEMLTLAWVDLAIAVTLALAAYGSLFGGFRLKVGTSAVLSARHLWRLWVVAASLTAARLAVVRRFPLDPRPRFARWTLAHRQDATLTYFLIALTSLWLSVGPPLGLWPLVYWLPGLNFIRVPSRFVLLAVLAVGVLAGIGFDRVAGRTRRVRAIVGTMLGALLLAEFAAMPFDIAPASVNVPAIDRWIARQPSIHAIAEVPVANPSDLSRSERRHSAYMLHSTAHWRKTVEGYSGIRPPLHEHLYANLITFPDERSLGALTDLGVTHVVVHEDLYEPPEWTEVEARLRQFTDWLHLETREGNARVYSLHRP